MKTFLTAALLILFIGNIGAVDIESYQFIDFIRAISAPAKPEIYEDGVVFTASSSHKRVGISFAHEGYAKVHWFRRLMVPRDQAELFVNGRFQKSVNPNLDSGIMFHIQAIPLNLKNMDYRMIIDGLWTTDPVNPLSVSGSLGILESRVPLAGYSASVYQKEPEASQAAKMQGTCSFSFKAAEGETVTVCGTFNNWDPFMYELIETRPGFYSLTLPLPPGTYQYAFYYRGEKIPDPANANMRYSRDGRIVSEAVVR